MKKWRIVSNYPRGSFRVCMLDSEDGVQIFELARSWRPRLCKRAEEYQLLDGGLGDVGVTECMYPGGALGIRKRSGCAVLVGSGTKSERACWRRSGQGCLLVVQEGVPIIS